VRHKKSRRLKHGQIAVAVAFFIELGLVLEGETTDERRWADKVADLNSGETTSQ
jgi:hypothetical protein